MTGKQLGLLQFVLLTEIVGSRFILQLQIANGYLNYPSMPI